jgi:hypothetical protein
MPRPVHRRRAQVTLVPIAAALLVAGCGGSGVTGGSATPSAAASGSTASASGSAASASASSSASPGVSPSEVAGLVGMPATEILAATRKAMKGADSTHMKGAFDAEDGSFKLDVVMTRAGDSNATVTIADLGTLKIRTIGKTAYINGDDAFWAAFGLPAKQFHGKWIKTSTDNKDFKEFLQLTSLAKWSDEVLNPDGTLSVVAGKPFDGVGTVGLDDGTGADSGTLYVAGAGEAFPMALESQDGKNNLTFTDWNEPVSIAAPPAASVITP